eukprot:59551-Prorocentrum_minimum.AAC.5
MAFMFKQELNAESVDPHKRQICRRGCFQGLRLRDGAEAQSAVPQYYWADGEVHLTDAGVGDSLHRAVSRGNLQAIAVRIGDGEWVDQQDYNG